MRIQMAVVPSFKEGVLNMPIRGIHVENVRFWKRVKRFEESDIERLDNDTT